MTRLPIAISAMSSVGAPMAQQCNGVYQGSVTNVSDPLNLGRVLLLVPQVLGTATSNWAYPLGNSVLFRSVSIGQLVHVFFLGGNRNLPVYAPLNWIQATNLTVPGNLTVTGTSTLTGNISAGNALTVSGQTSLNGSATIAGGATVDILNSSLKTFKGGSTSRSSSSILNDSDLQNIPYVANGVYMVELSAFTADSGNLQYRFSFSSSPANPGTYQAIQNNLTSQFQGIQSVSWTVTNTANTSEPVFIKGLFNNTGGAAGTFSFQWGSETNGIAATVLAASYLKLERFA